MDSFLRRLFLEEIQHQCEFAFMAYDDLTTGIATKDNNRIFYSVQGFLIATANISKIFWPQDTQYNQRGEDLKQLLGVDDNSPARAF
jgi:hypothetical protein